MYGKGTERPIEMDWNSIEGISDISITSDFWSAKIENFMQRAQT